MFFPLRDKGSFHGSTDLDGADLASSTDLSARFAVGFDSQEDLLYVAVVVTDDALRLGPSYKHTDACEIYLDADHGGRRVVFWPTHSAADLAALQYVAIPGPGSYGATHVGNPSLFLGGLGGTKTEMAFRRSGDETVYEWALQVHATFPERPMDLRAGQTVGFDVVVVDKDLPTDNPARIGWAPSGAYKYVNAHQLGDLRLLSDWAQLGSVGGTVRTPDSDSPDVAVHLVGDDGQRHGRALTSGDGAYQLYALPGSYRVLAPDAARTDTVSVSVRPGARLTGVDLDVAGVPDPGRDHLVNSAWTFRAFVGALLAFAMLHLLLYLFYPALRENLDFALFTFFTASLLFIHFQMEFGESEAATIATYNKLISVASVAVFISGLRFLYQLFDGRMPRRFWVLLVGGCVWVIAMWDSFFPGILFGFIAIPEMLRTTIAAIRRGNESAWIICTGFVLFTFTWLYQALMWINVLDPVVEYVYLYGFVGMLVPMSVYLARDFALTNRRLAVQLKEVQRLSELALEQERRARQEEVERRLLEVDNERKTQELEEARQLQTALLPVAGEFGDIDVAFHLTTATEVGGDYYDYVHAEDGSWIFAVGDATGHGARSSLVMATTKGLFNTLAETVEPDQLIEHMAHGIRSMNLGTVFMSLTLVRLEGRRLTVHAAGMPPVHVYRQATGKVDEVLLEAVPLGAVQPGDFPRWQGELHPEDVVLMMTDGLPERVNPDGELLGYERTVTAFAEACQESASGICQRLVQAGDDWARGQVSEDDVTLLAIKVPAVG